MKRIKMCKFIVAITAMAFINLYAIGNSFCGEVDILVQKLVEKGVITPGEGQQIITETKEQAKLEIAQGTSASVPAWAQNIRFKGDLRLRYQWQRKKGKTPSTKTDWRNRDRIRFRLGMDAKVNDKINVGAGFATGSTTDPRSTNQTLEDDWNKVALTLDYAYAEYTPNKYLSLIGGKMKDYYLWTVEQLLWDSDLTPNGAAMRLTASPNDSLDLFGTAFYGLLAKPSSYQDYPFMYSFQPGFTWRVIPSDPGKLKLKAAGVYYGFEDLGDIVVNGGFAGGGNSNTASTVADHKHAKGGYQYEYNSYGGTAELGIAKPLGDISIPLVEIPYLGAFGDYLYNPDPKSNKRAWMLGGKLGYEKVKNKGEWQISYNYRRLEKDGWVDFLSDSDFYDGKTDAQGGKLSWQYGLLNNTVFTANWYHVKPITDLTTSKTQIQDLVQLDLVFSF